MEIVVLFGPMAFLVSLLIWQREASARAWWWLYGLHLALGLALARETGMLPFTAFLIPLPAAIVLLVLRLEVIRSRPWLMATTGLLLGAWLLICIGLPLAVFGLRR